MPVYCRECKHFDQNLGNPLCLHPDSLDLVFKRPMLCSSMRMALPCGRDGHLYEEYSSGYVEEL